MQGKSDPLEVYTPEFFLSPSPLYAQLRDSQPVSRVKLPGGLEGWWITRYDDVEAALKDLRLIKNPHTIAAANNVDGIDPAIVNLYSLVTRHMLFSDPPDHTRLRSLVGKSFTPLLIERWQDRIQSVTDELLDAVQDRHEMEAIREFAFPIPITIISEMLGIPEEDREQFRIWSSIIVGNTPNLRTFLPVYPQVKAFTDYLFTLIDRRRSMPTDDLISKLIETEEEGSRLSSDELVGMIFLLIIAGHETTTNLIGNSILALLQHPDQMRLLQHDPALIKSAVEEFLRYDAPVYSATSRWAREDFELRGQKISRGDLVLVILASANHDERFFENPETLDITRRANHHLAFGKGIHYCMGAPLARLEGQIAINTLLRRMPDLRLTIDPQELRWRTGLLVHALERLPVSF